MGVMVSNNGAEPGTGRAGFTYESGGSVSWIKPSSGPKRGGTVVTVTGSNLDREAARTECERRRTRRCWAGARGLDEIVSYKGIWLAEPLFTVGYNRLLRPLRTTSALSLPSLTPILLTHSQLWSLSDSVVSL